MIHALDAMSYMFKKNELHDHTSSRILRGEEGVYLNEANIYLLLRITHSSKLEIIQYFLSFFLIYIFAFLRNNTQLTNSG